MGSTKPKVITDAGLADFVQHILSDKARSSHLVVCTSKETFIQRLLNACVETDGNIDEHPSEDGEHVMGEPRNTEPHDLLKCLSLLQLASSRSVKLAFCPDITHLRAHLSNLAARLAENRPDSAKQDMSILAILNPIDIHRSTPSFSAQGLNRTFALAVEAAHATKSHLHMIEFPSFRSHATEHFEAEYDLEPELIPPPPPSDPWDEEVSILNVTTKSFGAGGRGWVGRTVTIRRIAERWCLFRRL